MNDSPTNGRSRGGVDDIGGDDISELTRLLPPPAAPDMTAGRSQALRAHLVAEVTGEQRGAAPVPGYAPSRHRPAQWRLAQWRLAQWPLTRWPRRRGWLVAGLASAVAVGAATAVGVSALVAGGPGGASPAAVTLLAKIATAAARQPTPTVSDSEFVYIRSQVAFRVDSVVNGQDTVTMDSPHERQTWLPVNSTCDGLLIERGHRTALSPSSGVVGYESTGSGPAKPIAPQCAGGVNDPTYRFLQSLPTDPRTLLGFIYDKTQGEGQSQGRDGEAFITIGDMIRESIVPPQTAAALYRAAALIPGVSVVGHATNAVGRPGVAVAWTGGSDHATYEWIFNAKTYQFIGEQDTDGKTAILQQAFVAKAGQLP
jgi:hypothetical protein